MTKIKNMIALLYGVMGTLVYASVALAEEAGHAEEAVSFTADWLPRLVNFAIITAILVYFLRKPTRDFFANRTKEIEKSLKESREARDRAVAALADMERKIRELEVETRNMVAEARARGEKDKQALIEEGKKVVQDVQEQVKTGIDVEVRKAKADLAVEAAALSVDLAEGKIKSSIGKPDHERIVKEYIAKVGGRG